MDSLLVSGLKDMHEHGEGIIWYMLGQYCPLSLFNHTRTVLSSETLMTPSSLGTITAIFTTSWDPSTRCSRIGLRVSGVGWISAAIGGGGAPGAPLPTAQWSWVEETAQGQARAEKRTLVGPSGKPGTRDHSLAAAPGNDSALPA